VSLLTAIAIAEKRQGKFSERFYAGRSRSVLQRSWMTFRSSTYLVVLSGFVEPVLNLVVFGFGVGGLVGDVTLPDGRQISYASYIVPGLLATSAMMGAVMDATWNVYFKMHESRLYQAMLATSLGPMDVALGEIVWALFRGALYSTSFMIVVTPLGLVHSWWGLLAVPVGVVIGFGFAALGMALTSYVKGFQQLHLINIFLLPLTLFSGSFFPLDILPDWLAVVIRWTPLSQGIEMMRMCTLGTINAGIFIHLAYFSVFIAAGLYFTTRRLNALFMK
jgi:lipooligosaccharide transport system permease protein